MKVLRDLSWARVPVLSAVVAILSGALMSHAVMAQEAKAVENFSGVLQREITLWSDGTRLSGVLLYPKDRKEGEKVPAIVLCNGWHGTKGFLMQFGIAQRFAAARCVVINYDYRGWCDSDSRLVVRDEMPKPDKDGYGVPQTQKKAFGGPYVTIKAQAIREVVDPFDRRRDIDAEHFDQEVERMKAKRLEIMQSGEVVGEVSGSDKVVSVEWVYLDTCEGGGLPIELVREAALRPGKAGGQRTGEQPSRGEGDE